MTFNSSTLISALEVDNSFILFSILIVILSIAVIIFVSIPLIIFFLNFSKELRYLNLEIQRSRGEEREHYKRERKKLLLSLIPFHKNK